MDTGQGGENDPNRALSLIRPSDDAPALHVLAARPGSLPALRSRGRVLRRRGASIFIFRRSWRIPIIRIVDHVFITENGKTPAAFDPSSSVPDIVVRQGEVEDWVIENGSTELHAFHIHQLHFLMIGYNGQEIDEPFLGYD